MAPNKLHLLMSYGWMGLYVKAIEYHQKTFTIRTKLGLDNEKNINSQKIIGCILYLYEEEQVVDHEYISLALGYYPELLQENHKVGALNVMKDNFSYFMKLVAIVKRDGKFTDLVEEAGTKQAAILAWIESDEQLGEMFQLEMETLNEKICKK